MTTTDEPRIPEAIEPDDQTFRVWTESLDGVMTVEASGLTYLAAKRLYHQVARDRGTQLKDFGWEKES